MGLELRLTDGKFWQISPYLAEYLAIRNGQTVCLYAGRSSVEATVFVHNKYTIMELNREWAGELGVVPGKWGVRRTHEGVRFGPIIGIVCKKLPSRQPAQSTWIKYLNAIDRGRGILLTPSGFDTRRGRVQGFALSKDRQSWLEEDLPWPDCVYIRTYPVEPSFKEFLQKEFSYNHFNTYTQFNKWTVYQLLAARENILPYLPETNLLEGPQHLNNLIEKHGAVFVKPCFGHKGHGVLKISPETAHYLIEYRQGERNCKLAVPIGSDIPTEAGDIFGKGPYIVQKALNLTRGGDRPFDFRVLMQKKDDGLWHINGLWGRLGASGSIITNLASGGEFVSLAKTLAQSESFTSKRMKEIYAVCFQIAVALDQSLGMLGEIGLDLCIDEDERLWVLEVNGMPGKNVFPEGQAPNEYIMYSSPMLFASYLSGFSEALYPLVPQN